MNAPLNVYSIKKKMNDSADLDVTSDERRVTRLGDLYLALIHLDRATRRTSAPTALFRETCRIAIEHGRLHLAWIGLADRKTRAIIPIASHGCELHLLDQLKISIDPENSEGHGPSATALRTNQPVICNDFHDSPQLALWRPLAVSIGFQSVACFPFHGADDVRGIFYLYTSERNVFDDTTIRLIEQMTRDISFALNRLARDAAVPSDDITELKHNQTVLRENALRYRQLVELSPETILVCREGKFVLANQAAARMLGASSTTELIGRHVLDFIHADSRRKFEARQKSLLSGVSTVPFDEQVWQRSDGRRFHAEVAATRLMHDGSPAIQVVVRDITARKRTEQLHAGQNRILNMVATGVELSCVLRDIALFMETQAGHGLCSILLLDADGLHLREGASPNLPREYVHAIDGLPIGPSNDAPGTAAMRAEPVIVTDIEHDPLCTEHRSHALEQSIKACSSWPIFSKHRKVLGTISLYFRNVAHPTTGDIELFDICARLAGIALDRRATEERMRRQAHYDGLTLLPNRFLFTEFLDQALRKAQRHGKKFAVFFLDLDRFKEVNDTHGHDAGDAVLKEIAVRLRDSLRQTDKIARMGGDEFYVLIEDLQHGFDAAEIAQKLLDEASSPIRIGQHAWHLSASIGIAVYPDDGATAPLLLRSADQAMYLAKNLGKDGYQFFSQPGQLPQHASLPPMPSSPSHPTN